MLRCRVDSTVLVAYHTFFSAITFHQSIDGADSARLRGDFAAGGGVGSERMEKQVLKLQEYVIEPLQYREPVWPSGRALGW